jgi:hypothetical protein
MTTRPGYVWDATASEWVEIGQAAVVSPFKYQASQPSSPATGDVWIDSDDDIPSVDSTLYYRWTKTMSGGETSLSGTDNNSLALKYTPGYESVFINGVLQVRGQDYVATTGTTVTGLIALTANDVVMVESIIAYSVGDTYTQSQIGSLLDAKSPVSTTGLVLLNTTTIGSAVSSVTVSNVFSATYDAYKIVVTGGSGGGGDLNFRIGNPGSGFFGSLIISNSTGGTPASAGTNNQANWNRVGFAHANGIRLYAEVINPFLAKNKYFTSFYHDDNNGTYGTFNGLQTGTASLTDFTITTTAGTMTGGTIKVYGYK